ncbi:MAG TPA: TolC family protein [Fimbriimonadaceae bacterium]|nr:TolC family protein [Fimbriimonadaceae bacterium]
MKFAASALLIGFASLGFAQTPPIQPKTPDVQIPGPLVLPPPSVVAIGKEPLTVEEAVAIALKNQPLVGIAEGNLLSGRGRAEEARADLLPNFVVGASYSKTSTFRGASTASPSQFTSSLTIQQLLFDFGQTRDAVRQQEALERSLRQTLSRTQQTVALSVKQAFYNLMQDLADLDTSNANVTNRQRQLDEAQARLNSGLGAPSDVVQAKTNLASAANSQSLARDSALNARVQLAQLLVVDPRTPIVPANSSELPVENEADVEKLVEAALNNRPDIKAAQEQVSAAKYAISVAKKGNLPHITASVGASSRGETDPLQTESGTFSINVTWNFADSGFTSGAIKVAQGNEQVARAALVQVTQQALADVSQAFVDLQSAQQRVQLSTTEVANAVEFVRIAEGRYTGGIGQFTDITTAQSALFSAQRDLSQARLDVERVRSRLRAAIGQS